MGGALAGIPCALGLLADPHSGHWAGALAGALAGIPCAPGLLADPHSGHWAGALAGTAGVPCAPGLGGLVLAADPHSGHWASALAGIPTGLGGFVAHAGAGCWYVSAGQGTLQVVGFPVLENGSSSCQSCPQVKGLLARLPTPLGQQRGAGSPPA